MDRSTPIGLIAAPRTRDEYGVLRAGEETVRTVFASVKSATGTEFHDGFRNGLNPQFVFTMFGPDYEGESVVEYGGSRYGVYRTYQRGGDLIELHAERKGGTNVVVHD